jgi:hypothetical protein
LPWPKEKKGFEAAQPLINRACAGRIGRRLDATKFETRSAVYQSQERRQKVRHPGRLGVVVFGPRRHGCSDSQNNELEISTPREVCARLQGAVKPGGDAALTGWTRDGPLEPVRLCGLPY